MPVLCFLITHQSGKRVIFDLGLAQGWQKWLGDDAAAFEAEYKVELHDELATQLERAGVRADTVDSIVLSRE